MIWVFTAIGLMLSYWIGFYSGNRNAINGNDCQHEWGNWKVSNYCIWELAQLRKCKKCGYAQDKTKKL